MRAFAAFTKMLGDDPDRAYYGLKHCLKADENLAVDTLMVSGSCWHTHRLSASLHLRLTASPLGLTYRRRRWRRPR